MMKTATQRIRQLIIGILAVLSLSISSVAACTCSHHESTPELKASCHAPSLEKHQADAADSLLPHFDESCACLQPAVKLSGKAEGFKLKKHSVTSEAGVEPIHARYYSPIVVNDAALGPGVGEKEFSGSTSSRGPPLS